MVPHMEELGGYFFWDGRLVVHDYKYKVCYSWFMNFLFSGEGGVWLVGAATHAQ